MRLSTWLNTSSFRYGPAGSAAARATRKRARPASVAHTHSTANRARRGLCERAWSSCGGTLCIDVPPEIQCNGPPLGAASNWRARLRGCGGGRLPARARQPDLRVERCLTLSQLEVQIRPFQRSAFAHGADHVSAAHVVAFGARQCCEVRHEGEISV